MRMQHVGRRGLLRLVFFASVLVGLPLQATAQTLCEDELAAAEEAYTVGRFDETITVLNQCLDERNVSQEEQRRAHRLLGLSYIGKDVPDEARTHVRRLLELDPDYQPDPVQDPPPFVRMVEEVRREARLPRGGQPADREASRSGIGKWLLIGGGVALAGAAAVLLLSGSDDDDGGNGEEPTTLDEQEPNDSPAQAQIIRGTPPITVRGNVELSDFDPVTGYGLLDNAGAIIEGFEDLYQVTISQPGLQITLGGLSSDGDIYLINLDDAILDRSIAAGTSTEFIDFSGAAGTYLIAVSISDDVGQQGLPASTPYTLTVDGAVSGSALPVAQQRLHEPGGADLAATFHLVAHAGEKAVPLHTVLPDRTDTRWTAYHEEGGAAVEYDATDTFRFRPGQGFWIESTSPSLSPLASSVPMPAGEAFDLALHPGWNIIANPFGVPVDWARVQAANGITQALWRWDGHFEPAETMAPAGSGEAYYFLNAAGREALHIAPAEASVGSVPSRGRSAPMLTLAAYREGRRVSSVRVGLVPGASHGLDSYDQVAPPGYFEAARLRLRRDVSTTQWLALATEARAPEDAGRPFDLLLEAPPHASITLQAEGLEGFSGYALSLLDVEQGRAHDMRRQPTVVLPAGQHVRRLQLIVGSEKAVAAAQEALVPVELALDNHPNPFNPSTTLSYTVPRAATPVRLQVFDVMGRLVRLLVDQVHEPGTYKVIWDGTGTGGNPVASGTYLARLQVGPHVRTRTMVLVK